MKRAPKLAAFLIVAFAALFPSSPGLAQKASIGSLKTTSKTALIRTCMIVADNATLRFELIAQSSAGIAYIEVSGTDRILGRKECRGQNICRLTGSVLTARLKSDVINVQAASADGQTQIERVKINPVEEDEKIYIIAAAPTTAELLFEDAPAASTRPAVVATAPLASTATAIAATSTEIAASATDDLDFDSAAALSPHAIEAPAAGGPELKVTVTPGDNKYELAISAADPSGIDFIEIMENSKFFDVQTCRGSRICDFKTTIAARPAGVQQYIIKTMNIRGGLSYQEEKLEFK